MQNTFEMTSPFTDAWCFKFKTFHHTLQVSIKPKVSCCSDRPWSASISQFFDTVQLLILRINLSRLVLLKISCWNSCKVVESEIRIADFCQVSPLCVMNLLRLQSTGVLRTALNCAKNHANWFRHCEDVSSHTHWPHILALFFWPTMYVWNKG